MENKEKAGMVIGIILIAVGVIGVGYNQIYAQYGVVGQVNIIDYPQQVAPGTSFTVVVEASVDSSTYAGEYRIQAYPYGSTDAWSGSTTANLSTNPKEINVNVTAPDVNEERKLDVGGVDTGYGTNSLESDEVLIKIGEESTEKPTADFEYTPTNPEIGETVSFDGSGSTGGSSSIRKYYYVFGDGSVATGEGVSHTYSEEGTYDVTLYVWNQEDLKDSILKEVSVGGDTQPPEENEEEPIPDPVADFTITPSNPRMKDSVTFNADPSTASTEEEDIVAYTWEIEDEVITSKTAYYQFTEPGNYDVKLTISRSDGVEDSVTKSIKVEDVSDPVARIEVTKDTVLVGEEIEFSAEKSQPLTQTDIVIENYEWNFDDGTTMTGETVRKSFDTPGNHSATLTIMTNFGTEDTASVNVTVNEKDKAIPFPEESYYIVALAGVLIFAVSAISSKT